jgi:hypothetical protein
VRKADNNVRTDYLEIESLVLVRFRSDEGWNAMWKYFVFIRSRTTAILDGNPLVNLSLKPRNCKPSEYQAIFQD